MLSRQWRIFAPPSLCHQMRYSTQAELNMNKEIENSNISLENARPFEEIPGPTKLEVVRSFLPGGILYKKPLNEITLIMAEKYGKLYRFPGLFGKEDIYITTNPDDYSVMFRNEGQWPHRRNLDTFVYHREVHRRDYFEGVLGIIQTNGENWSKMRTAVNPVLMQPKNAKLYLKTMLEVNDEFLLRIREIRNPVSHEMPENFLEEINRFTFETVSAIALNTQLGVIRKNRDSPEAVTIINGVHRFFELSFDLEIQPPIWKFFKTPKFHEMMKILDTLTDLCNKYITEAVDKIEQDTEGKFTSEVGKEKSVLEKLLKIEKKLAVVMALDMMMAGVDTSSSAISGILLCLAKNPEKQQKLFEEINKILPHKDSALTLDNMRNLPYLRACIKEGIRIYPVLSGTSRRMPHDVIMSGYRVKKGSDVTTGGGLQLTNEKFVPRAKEFLPERWFRNEDSKDISGAIVNAFMYLPFGFGPRMCVGKRIVELEIETLIARLIRNFNIEYNYSIENAFQSRIINVPNIPLKFKFEERNE